MTKVGLISDPHASAIPVAEALAIFARERVDGIWCTGDIAGYGEELGATISLLQASNCESILGNHEIWYLEQHANQTQSSINSYFSNLPPVMQRTIEGKRVVMVHASPPDSVSDGIRLLDQSGNVIELEKQTWLERLSHFNLDVLIVGHTHQVFAERLGNTLVINPGSSQFNHSCAILSLPDLTVQWFALCGKPIQKSWNWGNQLDSGR